MHKVSQAIDILSAKRIEAGQIGKQWRNKVNSVSPLAEDRIALIRTMPKRASDISEAVAAGAYDAAAACAHQLQLDIQREKALADQMENNARALKNEMGSQIDVVFENAVGAITAAQNLLVRA